jgi:hypothetical protein
MLLAQINEWQIANALIELRSSSTLPRCSLVTGNSEAIREVPLESPYRELRSEVSGNTVFRAVRVRSRSDQFR